MLRKICLSLLLTSFSTIALCDDDEVTPDCLALRATLSTGLHFQFSGIPDSHAAGSPLNFTGSVKKDFRLDAGIWEEDFSIWGLTLSIADPYPKIIGLKANRDLNAFLFSTDNGAALKLTANITPNIYGIAKYGFNILFVRRVGQKTEYCQFEKDFGLSTIFVSQAPDIVPPLIRHVHFDKTKYRAGENAHVIFTFSEALESPESDHISFVNRTLPFSDQTRWIPKYGPVYQMNQVADKVYEVQFQIPGETKPGQYHLEIVNRHDTVNNFADRVGAVDKIEHEIVERSPLVVE